MMAASPTAKSITVTTETGPVTFSSIKDFASFMGRSHVTIRDFIRRRKRSGVSLDDIATEYYRTHRKPRTPYYPTKPVTILGTEYPSIQAACQSLGISRSRVSRYKRTHPDTTTEQAIMHVYSEPRDTPDLAVQTEAGPEICKTIHEASKFFDMPEQRFRYILAKISKSQKITTAQALAVYQSNPSQYDVHPMDVTIEGTTYPTLQDACDHYGYSRGALNQAAIKQGCSATELLREWVKNKRPVKQPKTVFSQSDDAIIRKYYPIFGSAPILTTLLRTSSRVITGHANKIGLSSPKRDGRLYDLPYRFMFAYSTPDNRFYYWFFCKTNTAIMLLSADEILNYLASPSTRFCDIHAVPSFVKVPSMFIRSISDKATVYSTWLESVHEDSPTHEIPAHQ